MGLQAHSTPRLGSAGFEWHKALLPPLWGGGGPEVNSVGVVAKLSVERRALSEPLANPAADLALFGASPQNLFADDASLALRYRLTFDLIG